MAIDFIPKIEFIKPERTPEEIQKYKDFSEEWNRKIPSR
jgi:hypothetical protein